MTGYTVHTGASEKFVEGWDQIFKRTAKTKKAEKSAPAKKAAKKAVKKAKKK